MLNSFNNSPNFDETLSPTSPSKLLSFRSTSRLSAKSSYQKPVILVYGHYDVQPVEENWNTPPFEMTGKDEYIYGRGVSDNKVC